MSSAQVVESLVQLQAELNQMRENAMDPSQVENIEEDFISRVQSIKNLLGQLFEARDDIINILIETYPDIATKIVNYYDILRQTISKLLISARTFVQNSEDTDVLAEFNHFGRLTNHWLHLVTESFRNLPADALTPPPKGDSRRLSVDTAHMQDSYTPIGEATVSAPETSSSSDSSDWRDSAPIDVNRVGRSMSISISPPEKTNDDVESWAKALAATTMKLIGCAIANPSALIETAKLVSACLLQLTSVIEELSKTAPDESFKDTLNTLLLDIRNCVIRMLTIANTAHGDPSKNQDLFQGMRDLTECISRLVNAKADPSSEEWLLATLQNVKKATEAVLSLPANPSEEFIRAARFLVEKVGGFFRAALAVSTKVNTQSSTGLMLETVEESKMAMKEFLQILRNTSTIPKLDPKDTFSDFAECQEGLDKFMQRIQQVVDLFMIQKHIALADVELNKIKYKVNEALEKQMPKNFAYVDVVSKLRAISLSAFTLAEHFLDTMKWIELPEDLKLLQSFTDRFMNSANEATSTSMDTFWNDSITRTTDDLISAVSQVITFTNPVVHPQESGPQQSEPLSILYSQISAHIEQIGDAIKNIVTALREAPELSEDATKPESSEVELPIYEEPADNDGNIVFELGERNTKHIAALNINKLVEVITSDRRQESLIDVVILCYRHYISPDVLFRKMIQRYRGPIPPEKDVAVWKKQFLLPIQLRVCNFLKRWIETQYDDFVSVNGLIKKLNDFVENTLVQDGLTSLAHQLKKSIAKQVCGASRRNTDRANSVDIQTKLKMSFTPSKLIFSYEPMEIAEQLTLLDQRIFSRIKSVELLGNGWTQKDAPTRSQHVLSMINRFNQVGSWVSSLILWTKDLKKRARVMQRLIQVAEALRKLNNYNTMFAIFSGLNAPCIYRLKLTKQELPKQSLQTLEDLSKLFSSESAFVHYRSLLKLSTPPCLPYVGVFLSDLEFIGEGHQDYVFSGSPLKKLLNVTKMKLLSTVIADLQKYQTQTYNITPNPELLTSLNLLSFANERALNLISVTLEPRDGE